MLKSELVLDAPNQRLMEIILRESERLNSLITDFLLFAQPPKTNKAPCNICQIMDETIDLFLNSPDCHEAIRVIRPETPQDLQLVIDPDQMKQVFWNLLINAAQAMANGGEIRVQLETGENGFPFPNPPRANSHPARTWVRILVSDSGRGIPAQEKEKIFEPFYTTKDGGTGLGLSIVHKIIESHRGLIRVESETGRGSTFAIFLPMDKDEERKEC
jgi:signal transduction histidine kinase